MTNKLQFRISISETLINELYDTKQYTAYIADCITYYTERLFNELPDEQLLNMTIDDFRCIVYKKMNRLD